MSESEQKSPTAEQILKLGSQVKRRPFRIEGGGRVWIHRLPGNEAKAMTASFSRDESGRVDDPYDDAKVIQRCVRDDEGKPIFGPEHLTRIAALGNDLILALVEACLEINGLTPGAREQIAKNSGTIRTSVS